MKTPVGVFVNLAFVLGAFFGVIFRNWICFLVYANLMAIWTIIDIRFALHENQDKYAPAISGSNAENDDSSLESRYVSKNPDVKVADHESKDDKNVEGVE